MLEIISNKYINELWSKLIMMNDSIPSLWDAAIPRAIQNTFAMHNT